MSFATLRDARKAKDSKSALTIAGTVVPWVLGIIGLILVLLGIRTHRRS